MQLKTVVLAWMGMSVVVEASALKGRPQFDLLLARQGKGNGFGGANQNAAGAAGVSAKKSGANNANSGNAANAANAAKASASAAAKTGNNANNGGGGANNAAAANAANAAKASTAAATNGGNNNNNNNNNNGNANAASGDNNAALCLSQNAVQTGSANSGAQGADAGQAESKTDDANFINFCAGKTLTNGLQQKGGSCNGVVMGEMPASSNMVSTIITSPVPGKEPAANEDFNVVVQIANMQLGTFTNPDSTYYSAPQQLSNGDVVGHTHITIQDLGNSLTPASPLDASKFAFFKGINDKGDGQGKLQATVTGGLPAGNYRVCTMAGSSNHQPVLMPVAQRGAQDDCLRITIGGGNGGGNANANANANAAAKGTGNGAAAGKGKGN